MLILFAPEYPFPPGLFHLQALDRENVLAFTAAPDFKFFVVVGLITAAFWAGCPDFAGGLFTHPLPVIFVPCRPRRHFCYSLKPNQVVKSSTGTRPLLYWFAGFVRSG